MNGLKKSKIEMKIIEGTQSVRECHPFIVQMGKLRLREALQAVRGRAGVRRLWCGLSGLSLLSGLSKR